MDLSHRALRDEPGVGSDEQELYDYFVYYIRASILAASAAEHARNANGFTPPTQHHG